MDESPERDGDGATPAVSAARRLLVSEAIETWKRQLTDLGGRNTLLYYRDLQRGTLDLSDTDTGRLLGGSRVKLSTLFRDPDALRAAARRARAIRAKARENDEERGLETLYLGYGLATWRSDRSTATPNAPVLLYRLTLDPDGAAAEDFRLRIDDGEPDPELNQTLLYLLQTDFGVNVDAESLIGEAGLASPRVREDVVRRLEEACASVPDFAIAPRTVVGNFSFAKLPMVSDLDRALDRIADHPLLAGIAGDADARGELRERHDASGRAGPPVPPPEDEFLVRDADSSQSHVIAAAVGGADLVVIGPPGTGKSQTIANLIATLVARGRSVLFVAEKRAAIEAVSKRIEEQDLGDILLDLHDGAANRRRIYGEISQALAAAREAFAPEAETIHRALDRNRKALEEYEAQLHEPAHPWGVSAFEAQQRLLDFPEPSVSTVRLRRKALDASTRGSAEQASEDVRRFIDLDGPSVIAAHGETHHPWAAVYAAGRLIDSEIAEEAIETLDDLRRDGCPGLRDAMRDLVMATGLAEPTTLGDADALVALCEDIHEAAREVFAGCRPEIFDLDLDETVAALTPAADGLSRLVAVAFSGRYRRARAVLREHVLQSLAPDTELLRLATTARRVRDRWRDAGGSGRPPEGLPDGRSQREAHKRALDLLRRFGATVGCPVDESQPLDHIEAHLDRLDGERAMMTRFPELHRLEGGLRRQGFDRVIDDVIERGLSADDAASSLEYVWFASILDHLNLRSALAKFDGQAHTRTVARFVEADREHVHRLGKQRVKRAWAERTIRVRDEHPDQAELVRTQASLKRPRTTIRALFDRAPDVLTAVKPCWVMSPLVVAQVLPPHPCFDVVVFDEASQILPADAVSSLLRGGQAIVAGDPYQLPPTTFFLSGSDDEEDEDDEEAEDEKLATDQQAALRRGQERSLTSGRESILDVMRVLLPPPHGTRTLSWHYRSEDDRLITFSNAQESLYDWSLRTFPGARGGEPLSHNVVPFRPGAQRVTASNPDEVARVVELVLEHARTRPDETLGVIALGNNHAEAITEALRLARAGHPEAEPFFAEDQDEPPFVKNLERVQGDERDAIILSVGYGKTIDGRMRYAFGPLNREGGERRLNVAVTRARRRMTVVSSFGGREMDPERLRREGPRMLRDYLLYAASGGADLGVRARERPPLTPFERDVRERLEERGVPLTPQYGASGYWIDFAAMHPERRGEPVLAIEADGASYHSSRTARDRDRLRQEHLERLGWRFHRIWSTEWFRHREREADRAVEAWKRAVGERDAAPPADAAVASPAAGGRLDARAEAQAVARRGAPWPGVARGRPIGEYAQRDLRAVVRWVRADGRLHTEAELLDKVMSALGFKRKGSRITAAIREAIEAERRA